MDIVKTRDPQAVEESARIWAAATAKRDANADADAVDVTPDEAGPLIQDVLDASERSFLLTVSTEDDGILCFGAAEPLRGSDDPKKAELRYLGVAPGHWGEGWARRLLVALPDKLREDGFDEVFLWVYADNTRAIWVYESLAWRATDDTRPHPKTGRTEQKFRFAL